MNAGYVYMEYAHQQKENKAMKLNLKWKNQIGEYAPGESLWLGKIKLGTYSYNLAKSRGEQNKNYVGALQLPSLKEPTAYSSDIGLLKVMLESKVNSWFAEAIANTDLARLKDEIDNDTI